MYCHLCTAPPCTAPLQYEVAEPEVPEVPETDSSMDVYLSLINGVINQKKHTKWDNGALQVRALCLTMRTKEEGTCH